MKPHSTYGTHNYQQLVLELEPNFKMWSLNGNFGEFSQKWKKNQYKNCQIEPKNTSHIKILVQVVDTYLTNIS